MVSYQFMSTYVLLSVYPRKLISTKINENHSKLYKIENLPFIINHTKITVLQNILHMSKIHILKIPQGSSESANRRRTDNTMTKTKRTNNDLQNTTQKTKD